MEANSSSRALLLELPYDVFVDCLVPFIPTPDLARLRQTCKRLQQWVDDDFIWRKRIADDFNFPEHASARVAGWQQLYRGLSSPELFTWGEYSHGRLGVSRQEMHEETAQRLRPIFESVGGAPLPLKVNYNMQRPHVGPIDQYGDSLREAGPSSGIANVGTPVKITASGWGFHVLTTSGRLLAWGRMDGASVYGQHEPSAPTPVVLSLPQVHKGDAGVRVKQLSCGRKHAVALTSTGDVMEWHLWTDIRVHHEHLLPPGTVPSNRAVSLAQLEAGWDFTVGLFDVMPSPLAPASSTRAAEAFSAFAPSSVVYWRTEWVISDGTIERGARFSGRRFDRQRQTGLAERWRDVPKVVLPPLPAPPEDIAEEMSMAANTALHAADSQQQCDDGLRIVQVGCGEDYVVALTSSGLVYKLDVSPVPQGAADVGDANYCVRAASALTRVFEAGTRSWQLMEHFCVPSRIAALAAFAPSAGNERMAKLVEDKSKLKIKHISAQFRTWAAYTSSLPSTSNSEAGPSSSEDDSNNGGGIVLMGKGDAVSSTGPLVKPELQGAGVIKISVGDWHYGALTSSGRVLTWGAWSNGALGIWDSLPLAQQPRQQAQPPLLGRFRVGLAGARLGIRQPLAQQQQQQQRENAARDRLAPRVVPRQGVEVPTEVRFDGDEEKAKRTFVFDIAFAGWQSAAIAIDSRLVDGGQEGDANVTEEDDDHDQEEQDRMIEEQLDQSQDEQQGSPLNAGSCASSSSLPHAPPSSFDALRQRHHFASPTSSSIPALGPIASSSITTSLTQPTRTFPPSPPPPSSTADHPNLPRLLLLISLLFLILGLSIVLGFPAAGLSLSDDDGNDADAGGLVVWLTRLGFWAVLLVPIYLYTTIARWVGESTARG